MTLKKLIENLKTEASGYTYKTIATTTHNKARTAYILVSEQDEQGKQTQPVYLLKYRLDLNYLTDIDALFYNRPTARDLKAFEQASKK